MGQLLADLVMCRSSMLYMGPWSLDAFSGPERALIFIPMWNCRDISALPEGPFTSHSARPHLVLCPEIVRPTSPPGPLRLQCGLDDYEAVGEQCVLVVTFVARDAGHVAFVVSDCHVVSVARLMNKGHV